MLQTFVSFTKNYLSLVFMKFLINRQPDAVNQEFLARMNGKYFKKIPMKILIMRVLLFIIQLQEKST